MRTDPELHRRLSECGFTSLTQAASLLRDPVLEPLQATSFPVWLHQVGRTCDPDQALLDIVRLLETPAATSLNVLLLQPDERTVRLVNLLAASPAAGDFLRRHPEALEFVVDTGAAPTTAALPRLDAGTDAGPPTSYRHPDPTSGHAAIAAWKQGGVEAGYAALRTHYRISLFRSIAQDIAADDPLAVMPIVGARLADAAADALHASWMLAQAMYPEEAALAAVSVIGMGKCGARELNYISDVDVIFCAEPRPGADPHAALAAATHLATETMKGCAAPASEPALWQVDTALRPEGNQGALVRTIASHTAYYHQWAKTWEFQALLKARPMAGDMDVGRAYMDAVAPLVWEAASRPGAVEEIQAMRRRVEAHVPLAHQDRQLKLAPGGLRDVEFSAQLLQLVHGHGDPSLRVASTVDALAALSRGGYISRTDAEQLDHSYRFLRCLEHRIQFHRMKRTHLMPTDSRATRRLGLLMQVSEPVADTLVEEWKRQARGVRRIHERLFYRPLLTAVAQLSPGEQRLDPEAARARLAALGYVDPAGAMRHLHALTEGVSRAASIQRTLLPVMLGWFADEVRPDAGLLAFRRLSEAHGGTHWYLKMLRDEGHAAETLSRVLTRSAYATTLLLAAPHAVAVLGEPLGSAVRHQAALRTLFASTVGRKDDPEEALDALASLRRTELVRITVADVMGALTPATTRHALTTLHDVVVEVALRLAERTVGARVGGDLECDMAVIAMGRFGGEELGFGSDLDAMLVYDAREGGNATLAAEHATAVAQTLGHYLKDQRFAPAMGWDLDLRPEGRSGPIVRSLASYASYYERWSEPWERQALIRARVVTGDGELPERMTALMDSVRWVRGGVTPEQLRHMRLLKARMETERLPRGADPKYHVKLGPGGLTDVEWVAQLVQLDQAYAHPTLRTTRTPEALQQAVTCGILTDEDATVLIEAWEWCSAVRNALTTWKGRPGDSLPNAIDDCEGVWRLLGGESGQGQVLREKHLQLTRRARRVYENVFFGT